MSEKRVIWHTGALIVEVDTYSGKCMVINQISGNKAELEATPDGDFTLHMLRQDDDFQF